MDTASRIPCKPEKAADGVLAVCSKALTVPTYGKQDSSGILNDVLQWMGQFSLHDHMPIALCSQAGNKSVVRGSEAWLRKPSASYEDGACMECGDFGHEHVVTQDEDELWDLRQQHAGTIGRIVRYEMGLPNDDLLLRGGRGRNVYVVAVREGGIASQVGIKRGDRLVSVNGRKDFNSLPADCLRERLMSPAVLVFLGFAGALHAEVRCDPRRNGCGISADEAMLGRSDSRITLCEERVFGAKSKSLFIAIGGTSAKTCEASGAVAKANDNTHFFELERDEARSVLRHVLAEPCLPEASRGLDRDTSSVDDQAAVHV
mmetsp:Transcript_67695/g.188886  ORF Transcript_67695/g.188886 Transcript_67695/m.188886 type:complete len:317 (+) Transcript_67695:80-1030(+)